MKVEIKDRLKDIEYFRMALNMVEIDVDYPIAHLIIQIQEKIKEKGDKFTVLDATKLLSKWRNNWDEYEENLKSKPNE